jgi:hypothetical protein
MVETENGLEWEHRVVAGKILGRKLLRTEVVHHIDGNTLNNSPSNLAVMGWEQHYRLHHMKGDAIFRRKDLNRLKLELDNIETDIAKLEAGILNANNQESL